MPTNAIDLDDRVLSVDAAGLSAVSWPAVLAGAVAAAALSLILLVLGTGLGLSAMSPWSGSGVSAVAISWSTIAWIVFAALAASGLGGYIAGRLRVRWAAVHTDEVYFRDTAHGFLAWAVATLLTAAALTSAIGSLLGAGVSAGAAVVAEAAPAALAGKARDGAQSLYEVDSLFRVPAGGVPPVGMSQDAATKAASRNEIGRIFDHSLRTAPLPAADASYIGQVVAQQTGLSQSDAEARVNAVYTSAQQALKEAEVKAKQAADLARKNAAYASLWIFISLLGGAFFASLMATVGGRRRDLI